MLEIDKNLGGTATLDIIIKEPQFSVSDDLIEDEFLMTAFLMTKIVTPRVIGGMFIL